MRKSSTTCGWPTAIPSSSEQVIPEQTGLLVEVRNVLALAEALLRMIERPDDRLQMGLAGRQRAVEHFDIEIKVEKPIAFYYQLIQQNR